MLVSENAEIEVTGLDSSKPQLEQNKKSSSRDVRFVHGSFHEYLRRADVVADAGDTLLTFGQAAHWFDRGGSV